MRNVKFAGFMAVVIVGLLVASFFITTWLAMILGGMIGHFVDSEWLKSLGFWQYSPVWVMVLILKAIFGGSSKS